MKTVSGKIVSSKPVSLSKAANILSNFVTLENGASQSVSTYLRRASMAFNELVYLKKHHKKRTNSTKSERNLQVRVMENGTGKVEGESRKKEKKKKKKKKDGSLDNVEEGNENVKEKSEEKKKKKKNKRKNEEVDEIEVAMPERNKKRRRTEAADE